MQCNSFTNKLYLLLLSTCTYGVHSQVQTSHSAEFLSPPLCTYYIDARSPVVAVQPKQPRDGVTQLTVLLQESSVSPHMPVITASVTPGTVHDVVHTWTWLQKYAAAHEAVKHKEALHQRRMYPLPGVIFKGAPVLTPTDNIPDSIVDTINAETELGLKWTHAAAPSAMLMLPGQAVAVIGDVHRAEPHGGGVLLTFDLVHEPYVFSEFEPHGLQYHDSRAHYHFVAPPGVKIDAHAFVEKLQQASFKPKGLHIFFKGLPDNQWQWHNILEE